MHILDNIIKEKFLKDISVLINQFELGETVNPYSRLLRFLYTSEYFGKEIFEIYTNYYKRNFAILEILATNQGLDTHRQIFKLVKDYISTTNIKLTISDLVDLYLSHTHNIVVITSVGLIPVGIGIRNL